MSLKTVILNPGQSIFDQTNGNFLSVKSLNLPINAAFNGGPNELIAAGGIYEKSNPAITLTIFTNPNAIAVTLSYNIGPTAVNYAPADNSASLASTFAYGNLGIALNAAAVVGPPALPACDGFGFLQVTNGMTLTIPGVLNSKRRQTILFSVAQASAFGLTVLDANGLGFTTVPAGAILPLVTDATFIVTPAGAGICSVTIGQVYLN